VIKIDNILVATDFSEASDAALLYGIHFARAYGATLHLLHVVDDMAAAAMATTGALTDVGSLQLDLEKTTRQKLDGLLASEDRVSLHARVAVVTSSTPARSILAYAAEVPVDLIIVGTHGRTGLAHFFMGSVAQQVVRTAPCPVLTVRHPEREFVVPDAPKV
jgi:nucleotide-binding universal stress UspA family protein